MEANSIDSKSYSYTSALPSGLPVEAYNMVLTSRDIPIFCLAFGSLSDYCDFVQSIMLISPECSVKLVVLSRADEGDCEAWASAGTVHTTGLVRRAW